VLLAALLLPAIARPVDFPEVPLAHEVAKGVRTYSLGKGLERLYLDDRQVVGRWFDGRIHRDADTVLWISPSLVSRWLGYLEAKEKWPAGELESRWRRLRSHLGGRLTFVSRVSSFPKMDMLEQEPAGRADPREASHIRILWTSSERPIPEVEERKLIQVPGAVVREPHFGKRSLPEQRFEPEVCLLTRRQARDLDGLLREDWWLRVPFGEDLRPEFSPRCPEEGWPLGDFYSALYLASLPIPDGFAGSGFELRLFSPRKERVAKYILGSPSRVSK
jgi:hypothetical protein